MHPIPIRAVAAGFCVALSLPSVGARAETPAPLSAAVFNFQTTGESLNGKGSEAAVLLNAALSNASPDLVLVERQELDKILGEQEMGLSGTVSPDTAAKVGRLTGAQVLITGRLFGADGKYYLAAKLIGTETSRVYAETAGFGDLAAMDKAAGELAAKLATDLKAHADQLTAKAENPAAHLDRLKKLASEHGPLPTVSVSIAEQHLGQAVIDPAAQTELRRTLQQLGFEVIEPAASGRRADVQISGEAFSETAGRHGNLTSCRSRVELTATRASDGKLLLSDRQTDMAVDPAEHVAGKTALENAAGKLLDRLVPAILKS